MMDVGLLDQGHHPPQPRLDEWEVPTVERGHDVEGEVPMEGHDGMIGHQHDHGIRGILLLARCAVDLLEARPLVDHPERREAALDEGVLERIGDGLRDFESSIPIDLEHLTNPEQEREHDGEAAEGLTEVGRRLQVHGAVRGVSKMSVSQALDAPSLWSVVEHEVPVVPHLPTPESGCDAVASTSDDVPHDLLAVVTPGVEDPERPIRQGLVHHVRAPVVRSPGGDAVIGREEDVTSHTLPSIDGDQPVLGAEHLHDTGMRGIGIGQVRRREARDLRHEGLEEVGLDRQLVGESGSIGVPERVEARLIHVGIGGHGRGHLLHEGDVIGRGGLPSEVP